MEVRQLKADDFEQAIQLANDTFREQGHTSMEQEFPQVFSKELQQSFGAFDGEALLSLIGLVPSNVRIGEATLTVFLLGSVCTHRDFRQQGISTTILKEVYRYVDQVGASLLLVSGDRGMYMRNHCYHFGEANKYIIGKSNVNKEGFIGEVRKGPTTDIFQIDRLKREKKVRYDSSILEWQVHLVAGGYVSIFKMEQVLYVASHNGVIEGYAVIGMPSSDSTKEKTIVTEWGGDSRAVYGIFLKLLENNLEAEIEITIPWHEKFIEVVSEHPCEKLRNAGTINIVNAERLINQLWPYLQEKNPTLAQSLVI
ncbi:GNAT family N-acetyltransferase [Sporosarcina sp. ANT_H38]|uniref:GNAT family N-acetyltransferase n=1 Tax=Sporosarcina sp. ANT_H38 TaxID=2597358 RepID=UPI0011F400D2|nr:GNAT family N-acetyltransferase [Sporosarcina sp. ANT_H38]KAA0965500.1 GNAT family N-acetyltransferase [Sporosarcina sp. ANT_H38]